MITVNRKALDKELKEVDLFVHTKAAVADYKAELKLLEERGEKLTEKLAHIQANHTENLLKLIGNTDVDEIIKLKLNNVNLVSESKVVSSLLQSIEEEKTDLKIQHAPLFREALREDGKVRHKYNANEIVDVMRYEMLKAIADIGSEMMSQYRAIAPDVRELFDDAAVQEAHVRIGRHFESEHYRLAYWEANKTVISKNDIFIATGGSLPSNIRKPEVKK